MSELRFFPWLQTGLSRAALGNGGRANVPATVEIGGTSHRHDITLAGPGDVASIDPKVWGTQFPAPGADDAEETFMASIEIDPADLPWRLSRGPADADGVLEPWLVLIVVDTEVGVDLVQGVGTTLQQLVLEPSATPSAQLPDLTRRGHFAHVQSSLSADQLAVRPTAAGVVARLLCPRDLSPNRSYLAAVVPATAEGVAAGRGLATAAPTSTDLAWRLDDAGLDANGITLPVFTHWQFRTGPRGDFESLTERISGSPLGRRTGLAPLDITAPGPSVPAMDDRVVIDYRGALRAPEVQARKWPDDARVPFQEHLRHALDASADRPTVAKNTPARYRPRRDDPVVASPLYGEMAAGLRSVPKGGDRRWAEQLNLHPAWRSAAGLGANAVRRRAADYVAAAWRQLADAPAAIAASNRAVFGAAVSQRLAETVAEAEDQTIVAVTGSLSVARGAGIARGLPAGTFDPVVTRITRPSAAAGRQFTRSVAAATTRRSDVRTTSVSMSVATVQRAAVSGDASASVVGDFALFTGVSDALTDHLALSTGPEAVTAPRLERARMPRRFVRRASADDTASIASAIRAELDPSTSVAAELARQVPSASTALFRAPAPVPLTVELDFPNAIVDGVVAQSEGFVMPGLDDFDNDSAAVAVVEPRHVAAVLAGANHEILRELLWHGVPVDLQQTPIARYWETGDPSSRDVGPIARWKGDLADIVRTGGDAEITVVVVRATLFRRYPDARIHLVGAGWNGTDLTADSTRMTNPVFEGWLDEGTRYAAFDRSVQQLVGNLAARRRTLETAGWFVAFEEAPTAPRFRPRQQLATNSASHAAATYQPPFRGLIHAAELVGAP